jgi:aminoglycoside phosphotransferase (APT) family kinase protein
MPSGVSNAGTTSHLGADLKAMGIPSMEEYTAMYCRRTGRQSTPDMNYYAAYNFFKLAGILQGIVGRVRDGTAANANAAQNAAAVRPLAEAAWNFAKKAGAPG